MSHLAAQELRSYLFRGVGFGAAPLGNLHTALSDDAAIATVEAAYSAGVRYFDTAPLYGHGLSERRIAAALGNKPRSSYMLSTKVGRVIHDDPHGNPGMFAVPRGTEAVFDFSPDGIRRSLDASCARLGMDSVDIAFLHDPDDHEHQAMDEAMPTLLELRAQGQVRYVGVGMNQHGMLGRFVERFDLDCVLLAGRYTLLDRSGGSFLDRCQADGVRVVLGGVFNSGVLADPSPRATYDYVPAPASVQRRVGEFKRLCAEYGVPLHAVATQFVLRHPAVDVALLGMRSETEVRANITGAEVLIPDQVWGALDSLAS